MNQIARQRSFIADRSGLRCPDDLTSQRVTLTQIGNLVAAQDRADRACRNAQFWADPVLPTTFVAAKLKDSPFDIRRRSAGTVLRPRRSVKQADIAFSTETSDPTMSALSRDTKFLGYMRDGPTVIDDPLNEQTATMQIQTGISVGHEDLLDRRDVRHLH